jgi:hypothetical protein
LSAVQTPLPVTPLRIDGRDSFQIAAKSAIFEHRVSHIRTPIIPSGELFYLGAGYLRGGAKPAFEAKVVVPSLACEGWN